MRKWQLQEAKAQLSELIKNAVLKGPQNITVHGVATAVVISKEDYDRLTRSKISFVKFLRASPLVGANIQLKRGKSSFRDIEL